MPTYRVTDPKTGKTVSLTGDSPPTEQELEQVFATIGGAAAAPAQEAKLSQLLASIGGGAKDVAVGAAKGLTHTAIDFGQAVHAIPGVGAATDAIGNALGGAAGRALYGTKAEPVSGAQAISNARDRTAYSNPTQMAGGAIEALAEMAIPVTKAASAAPTVARAGQKFESVMSAARNVPVDITAPGNVALRISQLAERGGSMPMAVRKFMARVTDPNKAPMVYEEARDFASNISRLSANEFSRLTPAVAREVANMRVALNESIAQAAKQAGKLPEYRAAMREYAQAKRIRAVVDSVVEGAKRSAPYAGAAGAGYWMTEKLRGLLGG